MRIKLSSFLKSFLSWELPSYDNVRPSVYIPFCFFLIIFILSSRNECVICLQLNRGLVDRRLYPWRLEWYCHFKVWALIVLFFGFLGLYVLYLDKFIRIRTSYSWVKRIRLVCLLCLVIFDPLSTAWLTTGMALFLMNICIVLLDEKTCWEGSQLWSLWYIFFYLLWVCVLRFQSCWGFFYFMFSELFVVLFVIEIIMVGDAVFWLFSLRSVSIFRSRSGMVSPLRFFLFVV